MNQLVFLTRDVCVNTATMRTNLDAALKALNLPADYQVLDIDTVPATDPRGGYPTPTMLYANHLRHGRTGRTARSCYLTDLSGRSSVRTCDSRKTESRGPLSDVFRRRTSHDRHTSKWCPLPAHVTPAVQN
jgi:hypothetical protein